VGGAGDEGIVAEARVVSSVRDNEALRRLREKGPGAKGRPTVSLGDARETDDRFEPLPILLDEGDEHDRR
jgi:hypothetical protein